MLHKLAAILCVLCSLAPAQPGAGTDSSGSIDRTVSPCQDFYQYACGSWLATHPIPPDEFAWGRSNEMNDRTKAVLRRILEEAAKSSTASPISHQIGDYYQSCMDEAAIERRSVRSIEAQMDRINRLQSKQAIATELARLHRNGADAFFGFGSTADYENSKVMIAGLAQGGLSLPARSYYFSEDLHAKELRTKLVAHVVAMFGLLGESQPTARAEAAAVMKLETDLAKAALDRQDQIDPKKTAHKLSVQEIEKLSPSFAWRDYFRAMDAPAFDVVNVSAPEFIRGFDTILASYSLTDIKIYLRWQVLNGAAVFLPRRFVEQNFAFYGKTLRGAQQMKPRWKRCVALTDGQLPEALGQEYVKRTFPPEAKADVLRLVNELELSLQQDITLLPWMTEATRALALQKLKAISNKIGYPDHWIDYSKVKIARNEFGENYRRLQEFETLRQIAKIGQRRDPLEWDLSPPTINAGYSPADNNINFPAGILQPPLYSKAAGDAENLGGIGMVMGHELTHGFDNNGRQFDADGNLRDWWTAADDAAFQERAKCLIDEYSTFDFAPGVKGNGQLTLGENIADNGGLRIAYMTLLRLMNGRLNEKDANGFTAQQRFFLSVGQSWCSNMRDQAARNNAATDEHSIAKWRVNGPCKTCQSSAKPSPVKPANRWCGRLPAKSGDPSMRLLIVASLIALSLLAFPLHSGQPPFASTEPIVEPKLFAEGVISTPFDEFGATFSLDGKTVFFSRSVPRSNMYTICQSVFSHGHWSEPVIAPFSGQYWDFDPVFSPDGRKLFFSSDRPIPGGTKKDQDFDIWVVEQSASGWTAPAHLNGNINSAEDETFASVAANGTLYFVSAREGGRAHLGIYRSRLVDGVYAPAEKLKGPVNDPENSSLEVVVAPDESFLLLVPYGRAGGFGSFDIYVSYQRDGLWTDPKNLGPKINTKARDYSPRFSLDGKYLFWTSERGFATDPLDRPLTYADLRRQFKTTRNGWGNIYQIDLHAIGLEIRK